MDTEKAICIYIYVYISDYVHIWICIYVYIQNLCVFVCGDRARSFEKRIQLNDSASDRNKMDIVCHGAILPRAYCMLPRLHWNHLCIQILAPRSLRAKGHGGGAKGKPQIRGSGRLV